MSELDIIRAAGKLKRVKRQGWLDAGVKDAESVADHCYRTALIVAFCAEGADTGPRKGKRGGRLDVLKAVRMALIHDIAEAEVGDLTPRSGVPQAEKARREEEAVRRLGDRRVLELWREFDEGKSPEARVVREADVQERTIQATEYSREFPQLDMSSFLEKRKASTRRRST